MTRPPVGQLCHRRETADAALPPEVHVKRLDGVVQMMPQRHLVAVQLFGSGVERAPAHLGAEGAGILLVPVVEDDGADKGAAHLIGNIILPEQRFQRGVIHRLTPAGERAIAVYEELQTDINQVIAAKANDLIASIKE